MSVIVVVVVVFVVVMTMLAMMMMMTTIVGVLVSILMQKKAEQQPRRSRRQKHRKRNNQQTKRRAKEQQHRQKMWSPSAFVPRPRCVRCSSYRPTFSPRPASSTGSCGAKRQPPQQKCWPQSVAAEAPPTRKPFPGWEEAVVATPSATVPPLRLQNWTNCSTVPVPRLPRWRSLGRPLLTSADEGADAGAGHIDGLRGRACTWANDMVQQLYGSTMGLRFYS